MRAGSASPEWTCIRCTLLSTSNSTIREFCETDRPGSPQPIPSAPATPAPSNNSTSKRVGRGKYQLSESRLSASSKSWECAICKLFDDYTSLQCSPCITRRPSEPTSKSTCPKCDIAGNSHDFWSCRKCGAIKIFS